MRRSLTLFLIACVAAAVLPASAAAAPVAATDGTAGAAADGNVTVTVLSYNDIQTAAAENGTLPRLVELVHQRRTIHDNPTVVVGGGDQVSPHALSPVSEWRVATDVLNLVDPAADVVGNHEFDYGYDAVSDVGNDSAFPWLATNVVRNDTGEPFQDTEAYHIVERGGVRVGVIGLLDEEATYGKTNVDFASRGVTVENFTEVGPATARHLKENESVDAVVALTHVGVGDSKALARADDGAIDLIVTGDDEVAYPPRVTSGTIITEGKARAAYLGEVNLTVDTGANEVTGWNGRLIDVSESGVPANRTAAAIIEGYRANVSLDSRVATTEVPLDATFATNYHRESNYGNLVTDAMRNATGADAAITNAGGIRSDAVYGPGNLTGGDVFATLPFANTLVTVELTGAELEAALESQIYRVGPDNPYGAEVSQQVSGLDFEWNGATGEVTELRVGGEPVAPNETYAVAVNSYIADSGSGYPLADEPRLAETDTLLAEAVIDYLESRGTVAPTVEGRMERITTELGDREVPLDGRGVVTLRYDVSSNVTAVDSASFRATNGDERVEPRRVALRGGKLHVQFRDEDLRGLADGTGRDTLDVYGNYTDDRYDDHRAYWNGSVAAADLEVHVRDRPGRSEGEGRGR